MIPVSSTTKGPPAATGGPGPQDLLSRGPAYLADRRSSPELPGGSELMSRTVSRVTWPSGGAWHRYDYAQKAGAPLALAQRPEHQAERDHDGQRAQRHRLEEHPGHAPAGLDRV
jgi:hypothetical protein